MARPKKHIPIHEDLKSVQTLVDEGLTQEQIAAYYTERGYPIAQRTISRKVKQLNVTKE